MLTENKHVKIIESAFFLSPLIVLLIAAFNFSDTKYILSRLIPIVCVYALVRYSGVVRANLNSKIKNFIVCGFFIVLLFSFGHFTRDDEFSLPRTLIASLAYLLFVPWQRIEPKYIYYVIVIAAMVCGLNAFYERYVLSFYRVGVATNPIPYALYVSFLILSCIYLLFEASSRALKLFASIGGLLLLSALIMTDVRGVIIFIPFSIIYLIAVKIKPKRIYCVLSLVCAIAISGGGYTIFGQNIDARITQTQQEIALIKQGNLTSSIGIRLDLWMHGAHVITQNPMFGLGDKGLEDSIATMSNPGAAMQPHLHNQYLDFLARYGIVGTLVIVLFFGSLIVNVSCNGFEYIGNPLVNSMLMMLVLAGLTDVPLHHTHVIYLLTILCGLLIRFSDLNKPPVTYA